MADKQARRTEDVLKTFKDLGDTWGEVVVVVNEDGTSIGGGGGASEGLTDTQLRAAAVLVDVSDDGARVLGIVSLDPAALAALETTELGAATLAALETVQVGSLPAITLDAATLAALETIQVGSLPAVALDAPTLAALENTTVIDSTLAALQKAEDAPHASGDAGVMALAVRSDSPGTFAGSQFDYSPLITDLNGQLWVRLGTSSGVQTEDNAATSGASGMSILAVRRDAEASTVGADGRYAEIQVDSVGRVKTNSGANHVHNVAAAAGFTGTTVLAVRQDAEGSSVNAQSDYTEVHTDAYGRLKVDTARPAASGVTSVANAVANTQLLAADVLRRGATIFNDDTAGSGATLKVKLGAAASAASFTYAIPPQGYYEVPFGYNGVITAIASAATGNARITELF